MSVAFDEALLGAAIPADARVIPSHLLQVGTAAAYRGSLYEDDVWDLRPAISRTNLPASMTQVRFAKLPSDFRPIAKAFAWCGLNFDVAGLPTKMKAIAPYAVDREVNTLRAYWAFLKSRGRTLSDAGALEHEAWLLRWKGHSYSSRMRAFILLRRLHFYRALLPIPMPAQEPWVGERPHDVLGPPPQPTENTTDRIPRGVLDPIMRWALFFLREGRADALRLLGDGWHRMSPGWQRLVSAEECVCLPGTSVAWLQNRATAGDTSQLLTVSAYIVTAFLSGMRDGEIQALGPDAVRVRRDERGRPFRHLIDGLTFKKGGAVGQPKTWVVLSEVHEALEALRDLDDAVQRTGSTNEARHKNADLQFKRHFGIRNGNHALGCQINPWLREFLKTVTELSAQAAQRASAEDRRYIDANYRIAGGPGGKPWKLSTRQFRRTVAWYIATEPFGTVAGMRQFGHIREVTFLGYAGTKEAGFRDEIEEAEEIGTYLDIVDKYERYIAGETIAGPRAKSLLGRFDSIRSEVARLAGKVVDGARFRKMLRNSAHVVHPGLFNDCFFDSTKALCLKGNERGASERPIFSRCDWERCPNSCFYSKHKPAMQAVLRDAVTYRRERRLSANQKAVLDSMIEKLRRSLEALSAA